MGRVNKEPLRCWSNSQHPPAHNTPCGLWFLEKQSTWKQLDLKYPIPLLIPFRSLWQQTSPWAQKYDNTGVICSLKETKQNWSGPFSFVSVPKQVCGETPVVPAKAMTLTSETRGSGWLQATQASQGSAEPGKVYLGQVARLPSHFLLLMSSRRLTIRRKSYLKVLGEANRSHLSFLPNSLGSAPRLPTDLPANPGD